MAADSSDPTAADDRDGKSSGADAPDTAAAATTDPSATGSAAASTTDEPDADASTPYSPALIATAVALPVILIVGVLVAAFIALRAPVEREPLALGPVPAPAADGPACQALLPALPADLGDYTKSTLVERFTQQLRPGGWLFIGHSESLIGSHPGLQLVGRTIYQRIA